MLFVESRPELTFPPRGTHSSDDSCRLIHHSSDTSECLSIHPAIPDKFESSVSSSDDEDSYDESSMYEHFPAYLGTSSFTLNNSLSKSTSYDNESKIVNANPLATAVKQGGIKRKKFRKVRVTKLRQNINKITLHEEQTHILVSKASVTKSIDTPNILHENVEQIGKDSLQHQTHTHEKANQMNPCWPRSDFRTNEDVSIKQRRTDANIIKTYDDYLSSKGCKPDESQVIHSTNSHKLSEYNDSADERANTDKLTETMFENTKSNNTIALGSKTGNQRINVRGVKKKQSGPYKCDLCLKEFKEKYKLKEHYTLHTGEKPYQCEDCGQFFRLKGGLKVHIENIHSTGKDHTCSVCFKSYKTARLLKRHTKTHANMRFKCDTCGKSFATFQILRNHVYYKHSDVFGDSKINMECIVCNKRYSHIESLNNHLQIHEGTQKYGCDLCGAFFSRKADRARHRMTHTGEKPYKCDKCDYSCIQPGEFNRHKLRHGGQEYKYACPYCEKKLVRKTEMKAHILTHESGPGITYNTFQCKECGECLKSKYSLEKHKIEQHHYKIVCDECGKEFTSSGNRNRHKQRQHSNIAITCKLCSKTFKCKANLQEHVKFVHEKHET